MTIQKSKKNKTVKNKNPENIKKVESSQLKSFWKNDIIKGLIVASFVSFVGFCIWKYQHNVAKKEQLVSEMQIAFDKFSNTSTTAINYSFNRDKLIILQIIEFSKLCDSLSIDDYSQMNNILYNKSLKRVQLKNPDLYSEYLKALEFQGEFISSCNTSKFLFNNEIDKKIDTLDFLLSRKAVLKIMTFNNDYRTKKYSNISDDDLARLTVETRKQIQIGILNLMEKEIREK